MAQKAQEEVPHAPTSGTGAELVKQRMLLDSGSSALSPAALSTGLAAIPGNLCPQHLKEVKSGMGSVGRGGTGVEVQKGGRALVLPHHSWLLLEPGSRVTG